MGDAQLRTRSTYPRTFSRRGTYSGAIWAAPSSSQPFEHLRIADIRDLRRPNSRTNLQSNMKAGMAVWTIILTILAMYVAGNETSRLAGFAPRHDGLSHGMMMFGLAVVGGVALAVLAGNGVALGSLKVVGTHSYLTELRGRVDCLYIPAAGMARRDVGSLKCGKAGSRKGLAAGLVAASSQKQLPLQRACCTRHNRLEIGQRHCGGKTMRRLYPFLFLAASLMFCASSFGQGGTTSGATATCDFGSNKEIAVEYQRMTVNARKPVFGQEIPYNKVWAPGGKPLTLFLNSPATLGGKELPTGAYTMFVIPSDKHWPWSSPRAQILVANTTKGKMWFASQ